MSWNGRSSSQISIHNYPEHLNPFYEDENHKRLRFWSLKKNNNSGRRSSFSIENLRDLWSFKSFSRKKKSSTLGINKTSESPPILRRQLIEPSAHNSLQGRYSNISSSPLSNELNFSHRRPLRSSLQHINTNREVESNELNFNRNDIYRSTTQFAGYLTPHGCRHNSVRSSQSSLSSTNPFESDADIVGDSNLQIGRKTNRKKRRAPLPPQIMVKDLGSSSIVNKNGEPDQSAIEITNESIDIKSLTSQIEQFVNKGNLSSITQDMKPDEETRNANESNIKTEKNRPLLIDDHPHSCIADSDVLQKTCFVKTEKKRYDLSLDGDSDAGTSKNAAISTTSQNKNLLYIDEDSKFCNTDEVLSKSQISQNDNRENNTEKMRKTCESSQSTEIDGTSSTRTNTNELCIMEASKQLISDPKQTYEISSHDTVQPSTIKFDSSARSPDKVFVSDLEDSVPCVQDTTEPTYLKLADLCTFEKHLNEAKIVVPKISCNLEIQEKGNLNGLAKTGERPIHGIDRASVQTVAENHNDGASHFGKKKTVREVIESINRSQRLLNESAAKGTKIYSTPLYVETGNTHSNQLNCSNIRSAQELESKNISVGTLHTDECITTAQTNNFHKSKINKTVCQYRESSPTASNLDWNPLPKPKRTNNISIR